jgi:hypothetical protein
MAGTVVFGVFFRYGVKVKYCDKKEFKFMANQHKNKIVESTQLLDPYARLSDPC